MTDQKPIRLFVAASVPEQELIWLHDQTVALREQWPIARWTPIGNQHVTLKFLGATTPERLPDVIAVCASVAAQEGPAELALEGLGVFPSRSRARVLWAGLHDPAQTLSTIAGGLDDGLEPLGHAAEKRPFTPHLTLARFRDPVRIDSLPNLPPALPFPLKGFGLWRSHLSPWRARYEQLREFAFSHSL